MDQGSDHGLAEHRPIQWGHPASRRGARITAALRPTLGRPFQARLYLTLDDLAETWRSFEAEGVMTAYQRLDWVACIGEHLVNPASAAPLFVELREGATGRPLMILPLAMERRLGARVVTWLTFNVCDYAAPICGRDCDLSPTEALAAWAAVCAVLPAFDAIDIVQIPSHVGGLSNPLATLPHSRPMGLTSSGVEIGGDPATLLRRVGGKSTDRDLAKFRRRLDRRGEVRLVRARTAADVAVIFDALLEQRRRRFEALGRFDLLAGTDVRAFYRDAVLRSLDEGPAQLWGLSCGGEWIATSYNLLHGGTFHGLILTTAGDTWKSCSPGLVMVGELMIQSVRDGQSYFDLTIGDLPYKATFGAKPRELSRLLEHRTIHGLVTLRITEAVVSLRTRIGNHPRAFETLRTMRRTLRRLASRAKHTVRTGGVAT